MILAESEADHILIISSYIFLRYYYYVLKKEEDSASIAIRIYYKLCSVLHEPFGFDATCIQAGFAGLCCVAFVHFVAIGRVARALTLILPFIKYRVGIQSGALLMDCKRSLIELRVG